MTSYTKIMSSIQFIILR